MTSAVIQLLVLAGIALFLILRLKSVLGTREGFEKPPLAAKPGPRRFEVIEGSADNDIADHVPEGSKAFHALQAMKRVEPDFSVADFLSGARSAYEMILMAFERGELDKVRPFISEDVHDAFQQVVDQREAQGLQVEAEFVGVRETSLQDADFDADTGEAEITVRFVGEMTLVIRDRDGNIVEGRPNAISKQKDVWTFARKMGRDDPNWILVATGE